MEFVGRTDYQTAANTYTRLGNETLKHTSGDPEGVIENNAKPKPPAAVRKPTMDNTPPCAKLILNEPQLPEIPVAGRLSLSITYLLNYHLPGK